MKKANLNLGNLTEKEYALLGSRLAKAMTKGISMVDKYVGGDVTDDYFYYNKKRGTYFRGRLEDKNNPCGIFVVFGGSIIAPRKIVKEETLEEYRLADLLDFVSVDEYGREYLNKDIRFLSCMHARWFFFGKKDGTRGVKSVIGEKKFSSVRDAFTNPKGSREGQMIADEPLIKRKRKTA